MAIKKSELYSTLWKSCDELRGGMDASQYKDYVLVILFVKYVSDKAKADPDFIIEVPDGCYFDDFVALKGKSNIGEEFNKKMAALANNNALDGVINVADFCDENKLGKGKDMVETLSNLIGIFQSSGLDFGKNRASDDDLMGDAYEYLMKNFASQSGKSKGEFYTPAEVSRVMAKVLGLHNAHSIKTTIYDPTCGSGSLLLRAMSETPHGATLYGQEKDIATAGLARMNMILHGVADADIKQGDTINSPQHSGTTPNTLQTFDYVVANPPFSTKSWLKSAQENDVYERWSIAHGVPPVKNGDYAFLLHILRTMNYKGHGACILPHGVLFRGNAEAQIRKFLLTEKKCIKGIIGLPPNLFFGTGIPACIIILDKEEAPTRKGVFMIDAKNGYMKDGPKNRLREQDIHRIVDTWNAAKDVPHYARFVYLEEIEKNDYNLNIPRYIEAKDTEILQDIEAHLYGGIPAHDVEQMQRYWDVCPTLQEALFVADTLRKGYYQLKCEQSTVRGTIERNESFISQTKLFKKSFAQWCRQHTDTFYQLSVGIKPKLLIEELGSSLLHIFIHDKSLVDAYDVYDQLMNYWTETMQDDFYLIASDGWKAEPYVPQPAAKKDKDGNEKKVKEKVATTPEDLICDLLPVSIVIDAYFEDLKLTLQAANEKLSEAESALTELIEEQSNEVLDESNFIDNKLTDTNVKKRIKALNKKADADEIGVLNQYLDLKESVADAKRVIRVINYELLDKVRDKYKVLTEQEIKELVIEKKWIESLSARLDSEMQRVVQGLMTEVTALVDRYAVTLSQMDENIDELEKKVNAHLAAMGFQL